MEVIKKKILLEDYIIREDGPNWGKFKWDVDSSFTHLGVNVFFTQDADDMGIGTDIPFEEYSSNPLPSNFYQPLANKLAINGLTFTFLTENNPLILKSPLLPDVRFDNNPLANYFINGQMVTGYTEDRVNLVESYNPQNRYKPLFNMSQEDVNDYKNVPYVAVNRVITNNNLNPITYIESGEDSEVIDINNPQPNRGIYFETYGQESRYVTDPNGVAIKIPLTKMVYKGQGFNETNSSLSAITKEEYLFGVTSTPTVFSDVFIDRGRNTVLQSHLQLSEIRNMSDLVNYGNGYYKIQK